MAVQTKINSFQPRGIEGEAFSSYPIGATTYGLVGSSAVDAVKATGSLTISTNPSADDTVAIGGQTFKFVSSATDPFDVVIGDDANGTATALAMAINSLSSSVDASVANAVVSLVAKVAGVAGNAITLVSSASAKVVVSGATMANGADATNGVLPAIGLAYTATSDSEIMKVGGTGVFAGIAVNPKEHIAGTPLTATLDLTQNSRDGIYRATAALAKMGMWYIKSTSATTYGGKVQFNQTTGKLSQPASTTADAGCTLINGAVWATKSAQGEIAVVQLGGSY